VVVAFAAVMLEAAVPAGPEPPGGVGQIEPIGPVGAGGASARPAAAAVAGPVAGPVAGAAAEPVAVAAAEPVAVAAAGPVAGAAAPGARYAWPLYPAPTVRTRFAAPEHPYGRGHRGVDLVGSDGQAVLAARAGVVVFAGPVAGRGVVSVEHDDGLRTTYEPVQPTVRAGASVPAGAVLGLLQPGHDGCRRACLHWGVRRSRLEYLDPLVLLRPPRMRLLPVLERRQRRGATRRPSRTDAAGVAGLNRPRAPPAGRAACRPGGCAAGRPATR
jgi:murein DD-endopeptidase MepM/ murein hydrolase activator NlpD